MSDAADATADGRIYAESLMTLTLAAYSPNGTMTTDADGFEVPAFDPEGSTFGKVQAEAGRDANTRQITIAGVARAVLEGGLHIPISATVPASGEQRGIGWEYVVTDTGDADPALLGRRYLVVGTPAKSYATARRLDVIEL